MSQPLISVIVPIYNVAPYLRKCLDSLKNQTMKEIEIICIDDGSTDGSGEIADEYKSDEWPIFRIIHTENRGLSAARNRGIDEAKSEWIMFVDSDDWVEPGFCVVPYKSAIENQADLVIFSFYCWENGKLQNKNKKSLYSGVVNELKAHELGGVYAWNKIYKQSLFIGIQYPEGHVYEDYATTHKLVHEAVKIILLEDSLYHYVLREGSITQTKTASNKRDRLVFALERRDTLEKLGYPVEELDEQLLGIIIGFLATIPASDDEIYIRAKGNIHSCRGLPSTLTMRQKIALIIWKINRNLFFLISRIWR